MGELNYKPNLTLKPQKRDVSGFPPTALWFGFSSLCVTTHTSHVSLVGPLLQSDGAGIIDSAQGGQSGRGRGFSPMH
jgi:hypothetical protein